MDAQVEERARRQGLRRAKNFHVADQWIVLAAGHIRGEDARDGPLGDSDGVLADRGIDVRRETSFVLSLVPYGNQSGAGCIVADMNRF